MVGDDVGIGEHKQRVSISRSHSDQAIDEPNAATINGHAHDDDDETNSDAL